MSWPARFPGVEQLAQAPELAALEMLEVAGALSQNALLALHGELRVDDFIRELVAAPAVQACLADAIVNHIDGLRNAIHRYREYLEGAAERAAALLPNDF